MTQIERLRYLTKYLLNEMNFDIILPNTRKELFGLYRSLVNVRKASPISDEFLRVQDAMLKAEIENKGIVNLESSSRISLWKGDITSLEVDAIVNAANNQMEGCFVPGHNCIDNAIHTFAGLQLRNECHEIMTRQNKQEPTGIAKITKSYNLPCKYVIHTVGPIVISTPTENDERLLGSCYESCLRIAEAHGLKSVAFCCISTGVFNFPQERAAQIAYSTVKEYMKHSSLEHVIFNVFKDSDEEIYKRLLSERN